MRNRWLTGLIVLLIAFFVFLYIARIFYNIGSSTRRETKLRFQVLSTRIFPWDYYALAETGIALFQEGIENGSEPKIDQSIRTLRQAIALNPLYYPAHSYLAKALIANGYPQTRHFEEAVEELKIAARIRPSNLEVALDSIKTLLSLWPFLDERDRKFCRDLLFRNIRQMRWNDFAPVLELWWRHHRDVELLLALMRENPDLYYQVSQKLVDFRLPLELRWQFLAAHESETLDKISNELKNLSYASLHSPSDMKSLLTKLRDVHGYGLLLPTGEWRREWTEVIDTKKKMLLEAIRSLVKRDAALMTVDDRKEVEAWIREFLSITTATDRLSELRELLSSAHFFTSEDLPTLELKAMIDLRSNAHWEVISQVENFKKSLSYVRQESTQNYAQLLLTLCDAYMGSRLMSQASEVLRELTGIVPNEPEIYWRWLKVEAVFGPELGDSPEMQQGKEKIRQSRFLSVDNHDLERRVFILDVPEVEITIDPRLRERMGQYRLFQVFIDGRIVYESYVDEVPEKVIIPAAHFSLNQNYLIHVALR